MHHLRSYILVFALAVPCAAPVAAAPSSAGSLSNLLKLQTEAFAKASQSVDKAVLAKYLDPDIVFTNEMGEKATREELLADGSPPAGAPPRNEIVDWELRSQGEVATATFTDVVTRNLFGHVVEARFRSTEVWARRADGWKMIASDTAYVPHDPPSVRIEPSDLDAYVGVYQLAPGLKVSITRVGDGLISSTNGAPATTLAFELRDVAFTVGGDNGRRLFIRGPSGRIEGYISSRNGTDCASNA